MSTVEKVEAALRQMTAEELVAFRAWYAEFDAQVWDRQRESESASGKLD
jgi:hypothetical protein